MTLDTYWGAEAGINSGHDFAPDRFRHQSVEVFVWSRLVRGPKILQEAGLKDPQVGVFDGSTAWVESLGQPQIVQSLVYVYPFVGNRLGKCFRCSIIINRIKSTSDLGKAGIVIEFDGQEFGEIAH